MPQAVDDKGGEECDTAVAADADDDDATAAGTPLLPSAVMPKNSRPLTSAEAADEAIALLAEEVGATLAADAVIAALYS